jgi:outer membrane lipoprotein carrier protein
MILLKHISRFITAIALLASMPVYAVDSATSQLNAFVKQVMTYQANFKQSVIDSQGRVVEEATGRFVLERPGKFRWDYVEPFPQHIVADGERIWFYDVDLEQVTVKSQQDALADTPATLLSGQSSPEDKYTLTEIDTDDGFQWIQLIPKNQESNYQTITLAFDSDGLRQMLMKDSFEQRTRLVFSQAIENAILAKDAFVFIAPEGVDVVGDK